MRFEVWVRMPRPHNVLFRSGAYMTQGTPLEVPTTIGMLSQISVEEKDRAAGLAKRIQSEGVKVSTPSEWRFGNNAAIAIIELDGKLVSAVHICFTGRQYRGLLHRVNGRIHRLRCYTLPQAAGVIRELQRQ